MDEAEVIEQKYPFMIWDNRVRPDSEGSGRNRGAPGNICIYGTLDEDMEVHYSLDGSINPPKGVRGGGPALGPSAELQDPDGAWTNLPDIVGEQVVPPHHAIVSLSAGGGGYGDPHTRDPQSVLIDVVEGYITYERAKDAYGVALAGDPSKVETLSVDGKATASLRA
jgi:N-methylhydantoinase B